MRPVNLYHLLSQGKHFFKALTWNLIAIPAMLIISGLSSAAAQPLTSHGAIMRGDSSSRALAIVFTGDSYADGGRHIRQVLKRHRAKASFFFTGNFYRTAGFASLIRQLRDDGHYLGAHSDRHLLYCAWEKRDSLLVSEQEFCADLDQNYREMARFGIRREEAPFFMPPYEWYNDTIAAWTERAGLTLVNFTPGTRSNADYTTPDMSNYLDSQTIFDSILQYEQQRPAGLNGFLLLIHIGTHPARTDKLYDRLDELITYLKGKGYALVRIDELLE